jgi:hypothetical protein
MTCSPSSAQKTQAYVVAIVERQTRCIIMWAVCEARTREVMQSVVAAAPPAASYYLETFNPYRELCW